MKSKANSSNGQATNSEPLLIVRSRTRNYKTYTKSSVLHLLVILESRKVLNLDELSVSLNVDFEGSPFFCDLNS
jgi:hypothetical protein